MEDSAPLLHKAPFRKCGTMNMSKTLGYESPHSYLASQRPTLGLSQPCKLLGDVGEKYMLEEYPEGVRVINQFLSEDECAHLIADGESRGFQEAEISTRMGPEMFKDVRNNGRVFFDDRALAERLYEKIAPVVPEKLDGWSRYSLNERFRFYRYEKEQYFKWHRDGSFRRSFYEVSKYTFMVYLNEGFVGGETQFETFSVVPKQGSALVFPHKLRHQGSALKSGVKYVLRTDVMYDKL